MNESMMWKPEPTGIPWSQASGGLVCPACPDHAIAFAGEDARFELVMEFADGRGLGAPEAVRVTRRAPDWGSGPYDLRSLPGGEAAIAVVDYLERQTFDARALERLLHELGSRYPEARCHVWRVPADVSDRIAEDAYMDTESGVLLRAPVVDIPPNEFPMDVGWRLHPERVVGADGQDLDLHRGCLYVCLDGGSLVRYGWSGLEEVTGSPG